VARNEEGEFELILGNRQLLSVFFLVVLLLCLCFVGGYVLGRSAAPVLTATTVPPQEPAPKSVVTETQPVKEEAPAPAPVQTAAQAPPEPEPAPKPEPVKPKAEPPKPEPAKAKAEPAKSKAETAKSAKLVPPPSAPVAGRTYLQLSATDKDKAETMVDLLRSRNLPGMAAPIPDRPGLFRVLVGPLAESAVADMRTKLKSAGFPADQAIKRTF
jgi:outer membrane biosynthesis protein TonB